MNSREKILAAIRVSQPENCELPDIDNFKGEENHLTEKFTAVLEAIGGKAHLVNGFDDILIFIRDHFADARRIVTTFTELKGMDGINAGEDPHLLENIDLAILRAHLGVAENSAVWLTEDLMVERVLPFICQYLAVVIQEKDIVATMHEAYDRIGSANYSFAAFIAGPSKTADIEQSLVLGAHGPKGMTVFIMRSEE